MTIYVGRWDLLPEEWEGINGLYEKNELEIYTEIKREQMLVIELDEDRYDYVNYYTPQEFEEEFNHSTSDWLTSKDYWIKIF